MINIIIKQQFDKLNKNKRKYIKELFYLAIMCLFIYVYFQTDYIYDLVVPLIKSNRYSENTDKFIAFTFCIMLFYGIIFIICFKRFQLLYLCIIYLLLFFILDLPESEKWLAFCAFILLIILGMFIGKTIHSEYKCKLSNKSFEQKNIHYIAWYPVLICIFLYNLILIMRLEICGFIIPSYFNSLIIILSGLLLTVIVKRIPYIEIVIFYLFFWGRGNVKALFVGDTVSIVSIVNIFIQIVIGSCLGVFLLKNKYINIFILCIRNLVKEKVYLFYRNTISPNSKLIYFIIFAVLFITINYNSNILNYRVIIILSFFCFGILLGGFYDKYTILRLITTLFLIYYPYSEIILQNNRLSIYTQICDIYVLTINPLFAYLVGTATGYKIMRIKE